MHFKDLSSKNVLNSCDLFSCSTSEIIILKTTADDIETVRIGSSLIVKIIFKVYLWIPWCYGLQCGAASSISRFYCDKSWTVIVSLHQTTA